MGMDVDGKSDIFSFGVVLYEMATGQSPFIAATPQATLARLLNQEPQQPSDLNPSVMPDLDRLILRCLKKDAKQRPTAMQLTNDLKIVLSSMSAKELISGELKTQFAGLTPTPAAASSRSVAATPVVAPAAGQASPSGANVAAPASSARMTIAAPAGTLAQAKALYAGTKTIRIAVSIFSAAIPLSFFFVLALTGGLIKPQAVESVTGIAQAIVNPALSVVDSLFTFRLVYNGWNFMLAMLGVLAIGLRHALLIPFEKAENWAKTRVVRAQSRGPKAVAITVQERGSNHRLAMLREYAEAQKFLHQEKRKLAFLSIDVVGSTKMKVGEDKLVIEHAFTEYKKFVERILRNNNIWKVAWTPDGIMCAFFTAQEAIGAAQGVLNELPFFNDGVHRLRTPFNVRCGVNAGEVIFPEEKNMEEISDQVIDVAGHMQKYAAHGAIWLSKEIWEEVERPVGFSAVRAQEVDGFTPYEWRPAIASGTAASAS
jgi:class 3 adenylate cyclase